MVLIAAYVATVSFLDARVEERQYFSILKYIVGALAAIPVLYVLYKVRALYRHPLLLLKYIVISTVDVIDRSIYDSLYYDYLKELSGDITAARKFYIGSKNGRLEYSNLSEYHLFTYRRDRPTRSKLGDIRTKITFRSTVWDLISYLMEIQKYDVKLQELVSFYLDAIYLHKSTNIFKDQVVESRIRYISERIELNNLVSDSDYAGFMTDLMEKLFAGYDASDDPRVLKYVKAMQSIYGNLESYTDIRLYDKLDCIVLNSKPIRIGEGEFIYTKQRLQDQAPSRIVIHRNVTDCHLFYVFLPDEVLARSLITRLPSKANNYEGRVVTGKSGVYHCLSYKEFLEQFAIQHKISGDCPNSDTFVCFEDNKFHIKTIACDTPDIVLGFKFERLDGISGWLV